MASHSTCIMLQPISTSQATPMERQEWVIKSVNVNIISSLVNRFKNKFLLIIFVLTKLTF